MFSLFLGFLTLGKSFILSAFRCKYKLHLIRAWKTIDKGNIQVTLERTFTIFYHPSSVKKYIQCKIYPYILNKRIVEGEGGGALANLMAIILI